MPLWVGGPGSPSNTMSLGPRPTSVTSGILVHETVWPQYTRVTDDRGQSDRQTTSHVNSRTLHCNGRLIKITTHVLYKGHLTFLHFGTAINPDCGRPLLYLLYGNTENLMCVGNGTENHATDVGRSLYLASTVYSSA